MRVLILFFLGAFANGLPSCAASGSGACCFWMAPKTKAQPAKQSGGGGKKAKKDESTKNNRTLFTRWSGCPPASCLSCEQSTDGYDRDHKEGQEDFLNWVQSRTGKQNKGKPYPSGQECYPCYYVRRQFFNCIKQKLLNQKRKDNPKVDARFWRKRSKHVRKEYLRDSDSDDDDLLDDDDLGVTAASQAKTQKSTTSSQDKDYEKRFVTGSFEPLDHFARRRKIKCADDDELKQHIADKYPAYKVQLNKDGVWGVEILDTTGGYRFERGVEDSVSLHRSDEFLNDSDADEAHENQKGLRQNATCENAFNEPADNWDDHEACPSSASEAEGDADSSIVEPCPPARSASRLSPRSRSSPPSSARSKSNVGAGANSTASTCLPQRPRPEKPIAVGGRRGNKTKTASVANLSDAANTVEIGDEEEDEENADARRSLCDRFIDTAQKTMNQVMKSFGNDSHFDHSKQKSNCDKSISRLRTWGRKCGRYESEDSQKTSLMCFSLADEIEERQNTFEASQTNFVGLILDKAAPARLTVLKDLPDSMYASMISQGCKGIQEAALTDENSAKAIIYSLAVEMPSGAHEDFSGIGLKLISKKNDCQALVKTTQRSALLSFLERILKQPDRVVLATSACIATRPAVGNMTVADLIRCIESVPSHSDVVLPGHFLNGWCPFLWLDIVCVHVMGQVGAVMDEKKKIDKQTLQLVKAIVGSQSKIDARVRCYHKIMTGINNHGSKEIWTKMTSINTENSTASEYEYDPEVVRKWIKKLVDALQTGDPGIMADAICDLCMDVDESVPMQAFGKWVATLNETSETLEARSQAKEIVKHMLALLAWFLEKLAYHAPVLDGSIAAAGIVQDGDSGNEVIVRDDIYLSDPANLPEEVALMQVTQSATAMLMHFPMVEQEGVLVQETSQRADLHIKLWKVANKDFVQEFTPIHKLKQYAEINRSNIWAAGEGTVRVKDHTNPAFHLQKFIDKTVDVNRVGQLCDALLKHSLCNSGPESVALSREAHSLQCSLPRCCHELIGVHKEVIAVEEMALRISGSKNHPFISDVNDTLHNFAHAKKVCPEIMDKRAQLNDAVDVLTKHFGSVFFQLESKMKRIVSAMEVVDNKCAGIVEATNKWEFATVPWAALPKAKADQDVVQAFRLVEQFHHQFDNLKMTFGALADKKDHQPTSIRDVVCEYGNKFQTGHYQMKLESSKKNVAVGMIVNSILTSEDPKDKEKWPAVTSKVLKHIKEKLQFDIKTNLPLNLEPCWVEQVAAHKSSKSSSSAAASSAAPPETSTKQKPAPPASAGNAETAQPAKKAKLRRFSVGSS